METLPKFDGEQLKAWRARMGFSQYRASEILGCSRTAMIRWEDGRMEVPTYIGLACAAVALGVVPHGVVIPKPLPDPASGGPEAA